MLNISEVISRDELDALINRESQLTIVTNKNVTIDISNISDVEFAIEIYDREYLFSQGIITEEAEDAQRMKINIAIREAALNIKSLGDEQLEFDAEELESLTTTEKSVRCNKALEIYALSDKIFNLMDD